jgi:hypothetical protein
MTAFLYESSSQNAFSTTLNGTINDTVQTVTLTSVSNLVAPGVIVLDRQDGSGNDTPSKREYISFTGISGSDLTGVVRGVAGSTAQSHSSGALVEAILTVTHWTDLVDFLQVEHDSAGKHVISTATITYTETVRLAVTSIASIARIEGSNALFSTGTITNLSAASLFYPRPTQIYWSWLGSLPTLLTGTATQSFPMVRATRNWTLDSVFVSLLSAPSLGALQTNINYYSTPTATGTSIFSVLPLVGVGAYESLVTPGTLSFTSLASGVYLRPEIKQPNGAGELMISLVAKERT